MLDIVMNRKMDVITQYEIFQQENYAYTCIFQYS